MQEEIGSRASQEALNFFFLLGFASIVTHCRVEKGDVGIDSERCAMYTLALLNSRRCARFVPSPSTVSRYFSYGQTVRRGESGTRQEGAPQWAGTRSVTLTNLRMKPLSSIGGGVI